MPEEKDLPKPEVLKDEGEADLPLPEKELTSGETNSQVSQPNKSRGGFRLLGSFIFGFLFVIFMVMIAGGIFLGKNSKSLENRQTDQNQTISKVPTPTTDLTKDVITDSKNNPDWKSYTNTNYNFSFDFPKTWTVEDKNVDGYFNITSPNFFGHDGLQIVFSTGPRNDLCNNEAIASNNDIEVKKITFMNMPFYLHLIGNKSRNQFRNAIIDNDLNPSCSSWTFDIPQIGKLINNQRTGVEELTFSLDQHPADLTKIESSQDYIDVLKILSTFEFTDHSGSKNDCIDNDIGVTLNPPLEWTCENKKESGLIMNSYPFNIEISDVGREPPGCDSGDLSCWKDFYKDSDLTLSTYTPSSGGNFIFGGFKKRHKLSNNIWIEIHYSDNQNRDLSEAEKSKIINLLKSVTIN